MTSGLRGASRSFHEGANMASPRVSQHSGVGQQQQQQLFPSRKKEIRRNNGRLRHVVPTKRQRPRCQRKGRDEKGRRDCVTNASGRDGGTSASAGANEPSTRRRDLPIDATGQRPVGGGTAKRRTHHHHRAVMAVDFPRVT